MKRKEESCGVKVRELIELLKGIDPEAELCVDGSPVRKDQLQEADNELHFIDAETGEWIKPKFRILNIVEKDLDWYDLI